MADSWFYALLTAMVAILCIYWSRLDGPKK